MRKKEMGPKDLCVDRARRFLSFCEVVWRLKFAEEPPYEKLKHLLKKILLKKNRIPDKKMDWSKDFNVPRENNE